MKTTAKAKLLLIALTLCLFPLTAETSSADPTLIVNAANTSQNPASLRFCTTPVKNSGSLPSLEGLYELGASASAQFSESGLVKILKKIPSEHIIIVDLRMESHGFVDGTAVSWYGMRNWTNLGLTLDEIKADEQERLTWLRELGQIEIALSGDIVHIPFETVITEEELASKHGCHYLRVPVADHRRPLDEHVDRFVAAMKNLPPEAWVHFHCSAGKGRATTFMILYDIMKNGHEVSLPHIMKRQALIGGKDFTNPSFKDKWKVPYQKERLKFIEDFYRYWLETEGEISWTEWKAQV